MTSSNICRTCLRTTREKATINDPICSASDQATIVIVDLLKQLPIVNFTDSEDLPSDICKACMNEIERIYTFLLQCEQTEMLLKKANLIKENYRNESQEADPSKNIVSTPLTWHNYANSNHKRRKKNNASQNDEVHSISARKTSSPSEFLLNSQIEIKTEIEIKQEINDDMEKAPDEMIQCKRSQDIDQNVANVDIKEEAELDLYADVNGASSDDQSELDIKLEPETIDLDAEFSNLQVYLPHVLSSYECPNCDAHFESQQQYQTHSDNCATLHECHICLMAFQDKDRLLEHLENMHADEDIKIVDASNHRAVESDAALSDGEISPQEQQRFAKNISASLEEEGLDKLYCCFYCPKQFTTERRLEGHMTVHSKSHICKQCVKSFRSNHHLKAHNMRVHGIVWKKIECGVCHKYFACKADLVRHQLTHTKEKPYNCNWCTLKYRYKKFLENHIKQAHAISDETMQTYLKNKYGSTKFEYQLNSTFTCDVCGLQVDRSLLAAHVNGHKNAT